MSDLLHRAILLRYFEKSLVWHQANIRTCFNETGKKDSETVKMRRSFFCFSARKVESFGVPESDAMCLNLR